MPLCTNNGHVVVLAVSLHQSNFQKQDVPRISVDAALGLSLDWVLDGRSCRRRARERTLESNVGPDVARSSILYAGPTTLPHTAEAERIALKLRAFVADGAFPCVGAKAALKRDQLNILVVEDIRHGISDRLITDTLQRFAEAQEDADTIFVSQAVVFQNRSLLSEADFEAHMWQRLNAIHRIDAKTYRWDPDVASDPASPHFSMSVGGRGFFVVGLHPGASRQARRFEHPTMVFNLHAQFERLRAEGRYEKIRHTTIERDIAVSGSPNPMLATHGTGSAAAQYSGRHVDPNWTCPFQYD